MTTVFSWLRPSDRVVVAGVEHEFLAPAPQPFMGSMRGEAFFGRADKFGCVVLTPGMVEAWPIGMHNRGTKS